MALARGLMGKPKVLLLDEPSLGLAPAIIDELFATLAELRDRGITILLVDQMAALALKVADRDACLDAASRWCCGGFGAETLHSKLPFGRQGCE